jgi:hypothetical protein
MSALSILIGVLVTFVAIILVLYLVNLLPIEVGSSKSCA